jgi:hypothetical protein
LIRTDSPVDGEVYDTLVSISNDYPAGVRLKCYFVPSDCEESNRGFDITANQPLVFWVSDGRDLNHEKSVIGQGLPNDQSELKCWAYYEENEDDVGPTAKQISWNHLSGEATIVKSIQGVDVQAYRYNAWRFAAVGVTRGDAVGTAGTIDLTGLAGAYDACPQYLWFDVLKQVEDPASDNYAGTVDNYIALVPCKQDLTQEGIPVNIKADMLVYNENEVEISGSYICYDCWYQGSLSSLDSDKGNIDNNPFINLATFGGAVKVSSPQEGSTGPCGATAGSPQLGVLVKTYDAFDGPATAATPTTQGVKPLEGAIVYAPD